MFQPSLGETFLQLCWQKVRELNTAPPIRQAAVGYIASMLARSMMLNVDVVKAYIREMCLWCHQYIQRCDSGQNVNSLKVHTVFYSVCQAVFYLIAFRSRDLTNTDKSKF